MYLNPPDKASPRDVRHKTVYLFTSAAQTIEGRIPLTEVLRHGARTLLAQAIDAEVQTFLAGHAEPVDDACRRRLVRNGFLPEREIQTGIGPIRVRQPRVRDRGPAAADARIRFTSAILPRYLRRTRSLEELLPWLYLKGISSGDFLEALAALLGPDASGLSAATISRLKEAWQAHLRQWVLLTN